MIFILMRGVRAPEWPLKGAISVGLHGLIVAAGGWPEPLNSGDGQVAHAVEVDRAAMADHGTKLALKAQPR
jgi:hypothetical protein